jgi:hypothetical protein
MLPGIRFSGKFLDGRDQLVTSGTHWTHHEK